MGYGRGEWHPAASVEWEACCGAGMKLKLVPGYLFSGALMVGFTAVAIVQDDALIAGLSGFFATVFLSWSVDNG